MPTAEVLSTRDDAHVRTVVLNRPEKKNALSNELAWGIVTAVEQAAHDDEVWVIAGYPRIGGSPDGGLTWTLPQAIGYEQAMRFLLENRTVDADEALRLGMVGEVVPDEAFPSRLAEYCALLAERSPVASRLTKRGITRATAIDLEAQVRFELANIQRAFATNDATEARKAFFEKRQP